MKKLLFVLALGAFAACGSGENKTPASDTTKTDTVATAPADTTHAADTTKAAVDTTKAKK